MSRISEIPLCVTFGSLFGLPNRRNRDRSGAFRAARIAEITIYVGFERFGGFPNRRNHYMRRVWALFGVPRHLRRRRNHYMRSVWEPIGPKRRNHSMRNVSELIEAPKSPKPLYA